MKKFILTTVGCAGAIALITGASTSAIAAKANVFSSHANVGVNPKKGKVKYNAKTDEYAITGGGANIWGTTDAFEYAYRKVSGDVTLSAEIHFVGQGTVAHRKGALMIRQSLDPGAAYADVALHGDGLTSLQYRETAGGETKESRSELKMPTYLRIERRGDQFTLYAGSSESEAKASAPVTVALKDPVYVGLAVCSHDANVLETLRFSNVKLQAGQKAAAASLQILPWNAAEGEE
jgi:TolB protein